MDTVTINGVEYRPVNNTSPVQIVVLQRGWVVVGRASVEGDTLTVENASVIRNWGTTKGLGEIAAGGPTSKTVLDPAGRVTAHVMAVVLTMDCEEAKWAPRL